MPEQLTCSKDSRFHPAPNIRNAAGVIVLCTIPVTFLAFLITSYFWQQENVRTLLPVMQ